MLRLTFVGTILIAGLVASTWSRFAGLLTYVWYALFRPQEWMWIDLTSLRLSLVVGFMLVVPSIFTGVLPNLSHPISIGTALFLLSAFVAQINAPAPDVGWMWIDQFSRLIVVVLLSITILNTQRRILLFTAVMAGSLGFHTAKAGLASILGGGLYFYEGISAFGDNNGYAVAAASIAPLLASVWRNADKSIFVERWVGRGFGIAAPLSLLMIVGTMSRGGFLAAAVAVVGYIILQRRRFILLLSLTAVLAVGYPFIPAPEGYFERLETIGDYETIGDESALGRLHFWHVATVMAADQPLGVGLKNFEYAYDRYDDSGGRYGQRRSVHSSHFQVLGELGYFGAAVWTFLFAYAFWASFRTRRFGMKRKGLSDKERAFFQHTANGLIASMLAFIVGGAFVASALNDITWYTFGLVAALDRVARARARELDAADRHRDMPELGDFARATA